MARRLRSVLLGLGCLGLPAACNSTGRPMPEVAAEINATLDPAPGRFLPGDTLSLRFAHDTNLDQTLMVDSNGNVSLLLIGTINVLGKRPEQVHQELETAYKPKLASPEFIVNLVETTPPDVLRPQNRLVYVLGEVHAPGAYPVSGKPFTCVDALARAGGWLKPTALLKNILFVRWIPEENRWRSWRVDARPEHWGDVNQILVQANDVVYVPNTTIDDVDIWVDQYIRQLIPVPYLFPTASAPVR
jgi:polysaccharide biosynthesis/export protein